MPAYLLLNSFTKVAMTLNILDTTAIPPAAWGSAKKTKPLRAKPMSCLVADRGVASKFLLNTLEGPAEVGMATVFCIGETGDAWQQPAKKLLAKYQVTDIDQEGWLHCTPLPENSVECIEVTRELLQAQALWESYVLSGQCYLQGQWGSEVDGVPNLQSVVLGDFIARSREDSTDQWRVERRIWDNSYEILA